MMLVSLQYHVGGKFSTLDGKSIYEGGEVIGVEDGRPDLINFFDLKRKVISASQVSGDFEFYFKVRGDKGNVQFNVIVDDKSVRQLLVAYDNTYEYDIFVVENGGTKDNVEADIKDGLEEFLEEEEAFYNEADDDFETYQLKTYTEHSCSESYKNKFLSPRFIANHYKRRIRSNPRWKIKDMRETIREDFGTDVSQMQYSRAKSIITHKVLASYIEEYALLRTYVEELLRGLCKGGLLTAIARDANDQIYPIAWCVVEVESKISWDWFLEQLGTDLNIGTVPGWSFSMNQGSCAKYS
ncbi:hypothetical protein LINPERHAP2_LOCUS33158 [Linum perenne]